MNQALAVKDDMTLSELGSVFVKSGFFADTRDAAQAIVKVLAGRELGFGPMAAMTGVYIVKGRVSLSANLMAAAVKRTGKYNYRVIEHTDKACEIAFFEQGQDIGHSRFTAEDARKAGTQNMDKFPRNMLFARAMSNGVKWYCADVFGGPVYTPEEMGAVADEDGNVVEMPTVPAAASTNGHAEPERPTAAGQEAVGKVLYPEEAETTEPAPVTEAATTPAAPARPSAVRATPTAVMKIRKRENSQLWTDGCKRIATKYSRYQTTLRGGEVSGEPDYFHLLGAAKKCLFDAVTDDNVGDVLKAIEARAADQEAVTA